ncbi:MAG: DUF4920 domain-containing protein [Chitinophagales bacterium]|nr:DUF4920 domain-containing protein [Chitinophagaceae bacterium]MBP9882538.1 DUF4920 domain-containing protein [Chitinophagales bacterium]
MKHYFFLLSMIAGITLCGSASAQTPAYFGQQIDEKGAISMAKLEKQMKDKDEMQTKVTGTVVECCQVKGCWMTIDKGDGTTMRVKFKDYGFFVPKDIAGKTAIMEGMARMETTSVDEQRHYAEDAGKTKAEIEAITQPTRELVFEASGVIIK